MQRPSHFFRMLLSGRHDDEERRLWREEKEKEQHEKGEFWMRARRAFDREAYLVCRTAARGCCDGHHGRGRVGIKL